MREKTSEKEDIVNISKLTLDEGVLPGSMLMLHCILCGWLWVWQCVCVCVHALLCGCVCVHASVCVCDSNQAASQRLSIMEEAPESLLGRRHISQLHSDVKMTDNAGTAGPLAEFIGP